MNEMDLDRLLAEARANPPAAPDDFMARVLADAAAAQPKVLPVGRAVSPPPGGKDQSAEPSLSRPSAAAGSGGFWGWVGAGFGRAMGFGNAGVTAGLGMAALTGLWLGYADPAGLSDGFVSLAFVSAAAASPADTGLELVPAAELFLIEAE